MIRSRRFRWCKRLDFSFNWASGIRMKNLKPESSTHSKGEWTDQFRVSGIFADIKWSKINRGLSLTDWWHTSAKELKSKIGTLLFLQEISTTPEEKLTIEICDLDTVHINNIQVLETWKSQVLQQFTAQTPCSHHQHSCILAKIIPQLQPKRKNAGQIWTM